MFTRITCDLITSSSFSRTEVTPVDVGHLRIKASSSMICLSLEISLENVYAIKDIKKASKQTTTTINEIS